MTKELKTAKNKAKGYVALYRSIRDSWVWKCKAYSNFQAFVDLILLCNYEDGKSMVNARIIEVKRGSFVTSFRFLCDRWGWSNKKLALFLSELEKDGTIIKESDSTKTVITLTNYDIYQFSRTEEARKDDRDYEAKTDTDYGEQTDKRGFSFRPSISADQVFISLSLKNGLSYLVTFEEVEAYKRFFPGVDVEQELNNMKRWLLINPKKQRAEEFMERFINNWFINADKNQASRSGFTGMGFTPLGPVNEALEVDPEEDFVAILKKHRAQQAREQRSEKESEGSCGKK